MDKTNVKGVRMEFRDLKKQYQTLKVDIDRAISEVLDSSQFIMGKQVKKLEEELAEYVGRKYCITCANGTDALSLSISALGIGKGDAVFVPDFTFFSTAEIVEYAGATPVFVDVERDTYNISADNLRIKIKEVINDKKLNPKAIIPVDLFGQTPDYEQIQTIADEYNLEILEDGAQGFGGEYKGKKACSFGIISTTSFFPAKPLGCYGDGGAIFTDSEELCELIKSLRVHGKGTEKYDNVRIGINSRLDTIQAAILLEKFKAFHMYELDRINEAAEQYGRYLEGYVQIPHVMTKSYSSWAQYTIKLSSRDKRDTLKETLSKKEIPSMIYYPKGLHQQTAFAKYGCGDDMFPVTSELCDTVLALPIHPYIEKNEVELVAKEIIKFVENR